MRWRVPRWWPESGLFRRRGTALLLTLTFEALLLALLLFMIPPTPGNKKPGTATVFSIDAEKDDAETADATKADAKPRAEKAAARPPTPQPPVTPPPVPVPPPPTGPPPFIVLTKEENRAAQITNFPQRPSESAAAAASSSGSSSSADDTPLAGGRAPGGEPLYRAEWYRHPRQVELDAYLPRSWAKGGSGLIACRTVARYHVDDCVILGESPRGSGYGNAVLQAAFQFLVRPPRVGGKELVGSWVSIRIDYTMIAK